MFDCKLGSIQLNLSKGASGDFLLTLPYKTKIKFVLFPSPQYPPSCNLALIDQEPREVSEKIQVIFILCFCDRIIKKTFTCFTRETILLLSCFSAKMELWCRVVHYLYKLSQN